MLANDNLTDSGSPDSLIIAGRDYGAARVVGLDVLLAEVEKAKREAEAAELKQKEEAKETEARKRSVKPNLLFSVLILNWHSEKPSNFTLN